MRDSARWFHGKAQISGCVMLFNGGGVFNQMYVCQTDQLFFIFEVFSLVNLKNTILKSYLCEAFVAILG